MKKTLHKTAAVVSMGLMALAPVGMVAAPAVASANILDGGLFNGNDMDLGDLFLLDRLFGDNSGIFGGGGTDLGDLIILDELFGNDNGIFNGNNDVDLNGDNLFNGDFDFGDLFILDRLFTGDNDVDLGDLFILDQLFN